MNQNDSVNAYSVSDNGRCNHGFSSRGSLVMKSAPVAAQPSNGTLQQTGALSFQYSAKLGFKGSDSYAICVCGQSQGGAGCSTINYAMKVQ